jgi:PAS domain-containing protein
MSKKPTYEELEQEIRELKKELFGFKRIEMELRESEYRYAKAAEIAKFGHWDRDFEKNKAICSKETYRIFGVDPDHFEPSWENFINIIHPSDRDHVTKTTENALSQGTKADFFYRINRPDRTGRVIH